MTRVACCWPDCSEKKQPAGIKNHEIWCDHNPNPGVPPDKQDTVQKAGGSDTDTNPHQEVVNDGADLPPREMLPEGKTTSEPAQPAKSGESCPNCTNSDVTSAREARKSYLEENRGNPNKRVVLAFTEAGKYCEECFYLWGGNFPEPVALETAVRGGVA